jgi:hypothetical protein
MAKYSTHWTTVTAHSAWLGIPSTQYMYTPMLTQAYSTNWFVSTTSLNKHPLRAAT